MKKTLLFLFAFVLAAVNMMAQNETKITWTGADAWTAGEGTLTLTQDPFAVTAKAEGQTPPAINANSNDARVCQRYGKRGYHGREHDADGVRHIEKRYVPFG